MARAGIGDSVEGIHAVAAAVAAGRVTRLSVSVNRLDSPDLAALLEAAEAAGVVIAAVDDVRDISATDAPQGVVATCRPIRLASLTDAVAATDPPALVVLDHLEDPRNVGAIARSALAAGIRGMVVPDRRAAPIGATAFKVAAGAFEHLVVADVSSVADTASRLREQGVWLVGLAADGEQSLLGMDLLAEPVALFIGAEGKGLSRLVGDRMDVTARVPLVGPVESLNASVAAALAMFETARRRGWLS